jgi:NAD(P)-dependent dehydrogenase (short-subunit alcohol dehydrogenase family)
LLLSSLPFTFEDDATAMIVGVGLMGQHLAANAADWMKLKRLVLVDHSSKIMVGTEPMLLSDFAASIGSKNPACSVHAETLNIADESAVRALFEKYGSVHYLMHTAGISPRPLTAPEDLTKEDVMNACEVNLWGAHNVIKQGLKAGSFVRGSRGVIVLSTSATVGSEGRASAAYEESKGGLMNFLRLQARYFVERYGLVLNGLAPSPLRGPMAAQNPISAGRLQAVEDAMPMGGLTEPKHISSSTLFLWSKECWCAGEVLTIDGGYTKHRPIFGAL